MSEVIGEIKAERPMNETEILAEIADIRHKLTSTACDGATTVLIGRTLNIMENFARVMGVFFTDLKGFESETYNTIIKNSMESNALIHALMKRGVITEKELNESFTAIKEHIEKEAGEAKKQKESTDEEKETGKAACG